jgi:hypothetical protein
VGGSALIWLLDSKRLCTRNYALDLGSIAFELKLCPAFLARHDPYAMSDQKSASGEGCRGSNPRIWAVAIGLSRH